jgi:hypothetical protein
VTLIDAAFHLRQQTLALGRIVAEADRLDEQITERLPLELQLAQDVEDLAAEGAARLLELIQEGLVDFAFAGVDRDEVPKVADLPLADTVNAFDGLGVVLRRPAALLGSI